MFNFMLKLNPHAKAVIAALAAGGSVLGTVAADGSISASDVLAIVSSVLGAFGVTWLVPNKSN